MNVILDRLKRRVVMTIPGFIEGDVVRDIDSALHAAVAELLAAGEGGFDLLVILDEAGPASQTTARAIKDMIVELEAQGLRRSANVTSKALAKMQIKRLSEQSDRFRFFADVADAHAWLDIA